MPDITLTPTLGEQTTGSGTTDVNFNWGVNQSRNPRTRYYNLSHSGTKDNSLIVTQSGAALSINTNSSEVISIAASDTDQIVPISGTANGRYMRYSSNTLQVASCKEFSGSNEGNNVSTDGTAVISYGETYNYTLEALIPANASVFNHTITISTYDNVGDTGEAVQTLTFTIKVIADVGLNLYFTTSDTVTVTAGSSSPVTFRGKASGRYFGAVSQFNFSLKEYSNGSAINIPVTEEHQTIGNVSTIYKASCEVASFGEEYEFELTALAIPPIEDTYYYTVWTNNSEESQSGSVQENAKVKVVGSGGGDTSDVQVSSVSISIKEGSNADNLIAVGETVPFVATVTPSNATIANVVWSSDNDYFSITQDSSNFLECTITGVRQGLAYGGDRLVVTVTDTSGKSVSGWFGVTIKEPGTITVQDMYIKSLDEVAQGNVTLKNIKTSEGFTFQKVGEIGWISGVDSVVVYDANPKYAIVQPISPNYSVQEGRNGRLTITGTDDLGNTVVSNEFTVYQEYGSTYECTSMVIDGTSDLIYNSNNEATFTVRYYPENSTQKHCTWKLTTDSAGNNTVSASIARLIDATDSQVTVKVDTGAVANTTLYLFATNSDNMSVTPASKTITVKYHELPDIDVVWPVEGSYVSVTYNQETDSTPQLTVRNPDSLQVGFKIYGSDGETEISLANSMFTQNPSLVLMPNSDHDYNVVTSIRTNNTQDTITNYIGVYLGDAMTPAVNPVLIQYVQTPNGQTSNTFDFVRTTGSEPTVVTGGIGGSALNFSVLWTNNGSSSTTFTGIRWTLNVTTGSGDINFKSEDMNEWGISDVTIASGSHPTTYSFNLHQNIPSGSSFTLSLTSASKPQYAATHTGLVTEEALAY